MPVVGPPDPLKQLLLARLEDEGRAVRYDELVQKDSLRVRQLLDELEISGDVTRLVVGDHIFYRFDEDDG